MPTSTNFPIINQICDADSNPEGALGLFQNDAITAERLALKCREFGHRISASTIRTYRRELKASIK